MRGEAASEIRIDQSLHGYVDGHRLLASSRKLPNEAERAILILSDMSGPSMVDGFESYLTGYPLPATDAYVLGRTWYAPERGRPGCVWTHSLIIDSLAMSEITTPRSLTRLFHRPGMDSDTEGYSRRLRIQPEAEEDRLHLGTRERALAQKILVNLYEYPNTPVLLEAVKATDLEYLILAIWIQQWPELRMSFTFCSGAIESRAIQGRAFELQAVPKASFARVSRRVKDGISMSLADQRETEEPPAWIPPVTDDILHGPTEFRRFTWEFGPEVKGGPAAFGALAKVYSEASLYRGGERPLKGILDLIADWFPSAQDAPRLKWSLFGSPDSRWSLSRGNDGEAEILRELCLTRNHMPFRAQDLSIRKRADRLWVTSPEEAQRLICELIEREPNPIAEQFLYGVSHAMTPDEAVDITRNNRPLLTALVRLNPGLATGAEIWRLPTEQQKDILDILLAPGGLDDRMAHQVIGAMLQADSSWASRVVVEELGDLAVAAVLDFLQAAGTDQVMGEAREWSDALRSRSSAIIRWIRSSRKRSPRVMGYIATLLDANSRDVRELGAKPWLSTARKAQPVLGGTALIEAAAFWLSLGFANPEDGAVDLVKWSFEVVHDAAAGGRLEYRSWRMVRQHLPQLAWWMDWDNCERLRRGLILHFAENGWPPADFLASVGSPDTFAKIVHYGRRERALAEFLRGVARGVKSGALRASEQQRRILSREFW